MTYPGIKVLIAFVYELNGIFSLLPGKPKSPKGLLKVVVCLIHHIYQIQAVCNGQFIPS